MKAADTHMPRSFDLHIRLSHDNPTMTTSDDVADELVRLADRLRHPTHENDSHGLVKTEGVAVGGWAFRYWNEPADESVRSWLSR